MNLPKFTIKDITIVNVRDTIRANPLAFGVGISVFLHACILSVGFAPPEPILFKANDPQLEIVLLNAGTQAKPLNADVLAQLSMEGGGDRDKGRASSPLPATAKNQDGDDLLVRKTQIEELEAKQRRLMALAAKSGATVADVAEQTNEPVIEKGVDPADTQAVIMRMQAEIAKQIEDYNKRPKRMTFGVNALGVSFAKYVDDWSSKVEEIGTARYPAEARGKIYDSLILTVEIDKTGNVVGVIFNKKSKHDVLNKAAREAVYAGAPYERFTPEMVKQADILQIVRTWYFTNNEVTVQPAQP
jgi:periplasmic protein TonB